ncbi:hypothetical protein B566_EDAN001971 [Ephemera danica]|nr:hypothetical protein B566_EDAN001971 [Ephemera danica]
MIRCRRRQKSSCELHSSPPAPFVCVIFACHGHGVSVCQETLTVTMFLLFLVLAIPLTATADVPFDVYWNVPTFMCHKYGINFDVSKYGITQNSRDQWIGDKVLILYDPGMFPAFLTDEPLGEEDGGWLTSFQKQSNVVARNGGIPQLGDLDKHIRELRKLVDEQVPRDFAVLDFESWRPTFRQNWASLNVYRDKSKALERRLHPSWSKDRIDKEAQRRFEQFGRLFMERTLQVVRDMRPQASWGYYAFPYCFNYTPKNQGFDCPAEVKQENNDLGWLYDSSDALFPSLYMSRQKLRAEQHYKFVYGRLNEAKRLSSRTKSRKPDVMPYVWYRYYDEQEYLTKDDLYNSIGTPRAMGLRGAVLWGSSKDLSSKDRCQRFRNYVDDILGPTVRNIRDSSITDLENRLEGRSTQRQELLITPSRGFWATHFLEPITAILQSRRTK